MRDLRKLLERFNTSLKGDQLAKESVKAAIKDLCGFDLDINNISIKGDTLIIKASPVAKSELKLSEEKLLLILTTRLNQKFKRVLYI